MESNTNSYRSEFVPISCIYPTLFSGTWPLCFWLAHERGCVTAVHFILFSFANYPPSVAMELKVSKEIWDPSIHHFHIDHNAPCLPPRLLHNHCFQFLLGITVVPREIEDIGYAKFWEVKRCIMVYVKLVNMEDKTCGISHEFVFRRNLNVHFVALPIRSVETLSRSNFFSFVDNSL